MIFSKKLIDQIYENTIELQPNVIAKKEDLLEEIKMFEFTMQQVKKHPWIGEALQDAKRDESSPLYNNIQSTYVGNDPEEDYKEVIIWSVANLLYVTAAIDHDPSIPLKWDVVVYNG